MRSKPPVQKLFIDPEEINPLFSGSMALKDVRADVRMVKVDAETGALTLIEFASGWYVQTMVFTRAYNEYSSVTTELVADTTKQTVNLTDMGIHRDKDEWNTHFFSVAATKEDIINLWVWLWNERELSESADALEKMFPEYIPEVGSEEGVEQQLQL